MNFRKEDNKDAENDYGERRNQNLDSSTAVGKTHQNDSQENFFFNISKSITSFLKPITTPLSDDRGAEVKENSKLGSNLETIENWLERFGKTFILPKLEDSLTQVKRNKFSIESHEKLSKSIDKELQKLSRTFHPDRAGDIEWQAALNAIRVVLKTLTEVFLENIFIDYKYEYFSRLDVRVLVNENERNYTIQTIFYKISMFSEAKRMNILGEIRKFLIESEKCVKSFLEHNESDFLKFRDYVLYHLRKNIQGYKKLEKECEILIKECSSEDESIRTVVQTMVHRSLREGMILRELEQSAKSSVQGNFKIFSVEKDMDEYYILPFVDYVNVLSMCNLLLQPRKLRFFTSKEECFFSTDDDRIYFLKAYMLAYDIYQYKLGHKKARESIYISELSQELHKTVETIFREVLQTDYTVDIYKEGKNHRTELLDLKDFLKNLEEKEKTFIEHLNKYKLENKESSDSVVNYRQDEEALKVGMTKEREIGELKN